MAKLLGEPQQNPDLPALIPQTTGLEQTQYGDNNTQVGQQIIVNGDIYLGSQPRGRGVRLKSKGLPYSTKLYQLFVTENDAYTSGSFHMPIEAVMSKCISGELKEKFGRLTDNAIKELIFLPALFASENHGYGSTDNRHMAYYGAVTGITILRRTVQVDCEIYDSFRQQELNLISSRMNFNRSYFYEELDVEHWTIKEGNLAELLREASLIDV